MSIVLPKSIGTERIYPNNTTAAARLIGTAGTQSTWTQIVAGTAVTSDIVMMGGYALTVFSESAASFSGDLPWQIEYGTGGVGSEVPIAAIGGQLGIQFTFATGAAGQIGMASLYRFDPVYVGSNSRLAARAIGFGSHSVLTGHYMVGYEPGVVGYPLPRPWGKIEDYNTMLRGVKSASGTSIPAGTYVTVTTPGTAFVYSASTEIISAAASDLLITSVTSSIVSAISLATHAIVDIGVGANGAEEWRASVGLPGIVGIPGPGGGDIELVRPLHVRKDERVAVRVKGTLNKSWNLSLIATALK